MSDTFTQLYAHIVFSVKNQKPFITHAREKEIYHCINGIIEHNGSETLIIDGTPNHIHVLLKLNPSNAISDLVREVKRQSSYFINHHLLNKPSFRWDVGYSAFSHTRSQVNSVYKFIEKQKEYHANKNFREEYLEIASWDETSTDDELIFKYKYQ